MAANENFNRELMAELSGLPPQYLEKYWGEVEPMVKTACDTTRGRWRPEDIKQNVLNGTMQLWTAVKDKIIAIAVTEIINYPGKKVCCVMIVCGDERTEWQQHMSKIEEWAKSQGCQSMEAIARKGWAKIIDWDFTHIFIEKEL